MDHILLRPECDAVQIAEFKRIGLDQPGTVPQDTGQKLLFGVGGDEDPPSREPLHDKLIYIPRERRGDAAGNDQNIPGDKSVKLFVKLIYIFSCDPGALPVDLRLLIGLHLDIDAGESFLYPDKIGSAAKALHQVLNVFPGKARSKPQRDAVVPEIAQHYGNIDPFAAGKYVFIEGPVDPAGLEIADPDNVIQRRIKCNCVDHR